MNHLIVLILLFLAAALLLRLDFIYYIVYVCVALYGWSVWQTPRVIKRLEARRAYNRHIFLGEKTAVTITIINHSWLPLPWFQISESIAPELQASGELNQAASLGGRQEISLSYQIRGQRRGYYRLGPLLLYSGDLFGFRDYSARLPANYLTIYPRIIPLHRLGLPSRLPFGTVGSRQRLFEDPARPQGIRDYRSGDSLRQINWKASAHSGQLVVKTFQPAISLEAAILLNLNSAEYNRKERQILSEWAIEVAASLAAHLSEQRQPVGLICNGVDPLGSPPGEAEFDPISGRLTRHNGITLAPLPIPPRNGRGHLMKLLEILARVETSETAPFAGWLTGACLNLTWGVTILAITPRADAAVCQALHQLARSGFNPVLVAIAPQPNFAEVRERARRLDFAAYLVTRRAHLERL
jgi:uncharacterized protein (DUF58 family)